MNIDDWVGYCGDNVDFRGIWDWQPSEMVEYKIRLLLWELKENKPTGDYAPYLQYLRLSKWFFVYTATVKAEQEMDGKALKQFKEWYNERNAIITELIKDKKIREKYYTIDGKILDVALAKRREEREKEKKK